MRPQRLTDALLGGLVTLLTVPTGLGPVVGGLLAGRRAGDPAGGALAGAVAGALGALPWMTLVYLASAGAIAPLGYHEGYVHVGVNTAAPGLLTVWQELALAGLVAAVVVVAAIAGGLLAGSGVDVLRELRADRSETV